ncbi:MAG: hypothetical protein K9H64_02985 [Bacteroidales bacterium]|nr:hypothetical protein [Bacteroidales bacterium]MCF8454493.1 hypothetical protein [Bacteroidales bacterium]
MDKVAGRQAKNGILSNSALERLTGINQKQMQHYASGLRKPREAQRQKNNKRIGQAWGRAFGCRTIILEISKLISRKM